ncbi:hypothetical protein D3C75_1070540 [compost metagenome]
MRLPMKPKHTPETTGSLPICLPSLSAVASTSRAVSLPRTTSSRRMTLAGLKKCRPITSCGREVTAAIRSTSSDEVLVARMAPGLHTRSRVRNTSCLTSMLSNTASITRSASARSA